GGDSGCTRKQHLSACEHAESSDRQERYSRDCAWASSRDRSRMRQEAVKGGFRAGRPGRSNLAAVVGPMQERLALPRPAGDSAGFAIPLHLAHVAADRLPAFDLPRVLIGNAAAHIVAAVPLKPAARVLAIDPAFPPPLRERLARVDAEIVERAVTMLLRELCACEPGARKFPRAVGHVLAAEHPEPQHLR